MTLSEFLEARIAEDEAVANRYPDLNSGSDHWELLVDFDRDYSEPTAIAIEPARVLAECEAKRRIVALHPPRWAVVYRDSERLLAMAFDQESVKVEAASGPVYDPEVRVLALPYADHPDYDEEWAL